MQFVLRLRSTLNIQALQAWRGARDVPSERLAGMIAVVPDGRLQQRRRNVNFNGSHRCLLNRRRWLGARSVLEHHRVPLSGDTERLVHLKPMIYTIQEDW